MADMTDKAKCAIDAAAEKAKAGVERAADAVKGLSGQRPADVAAQVRGAAEQLAAQARERMNQWVGHAGNRVQAFASDVVAHPEKVGEFGKDVAAMIRRHPIPAVLVGVGVGLLLGRGSKS